MDWLEDLLAYIPPAATTTPEPELIMAGIPPLFYTLFSGRGRWGARILEPGSTLIVELSDFGKPWREDNKADMCQAVKDAYPGHEWCQVSRASLNRMCQESAAQSDRIV